MARSLRASCALVAALAFAAVPGCTRQSSAPDADATDVPTSTDTASDLYERCGQVCAACGVGYCVAGGGSGHCASPARAECIVAAADDCFEIHRTCIAGPAIDAGIADAFTDDAASAADAPDAGAGDAR